MTFRLAGVPVVVLLLAVVILQLVDSKDSFESWPVLFGTSLLFSTIASVVVSILVGRTFLTTGVRGLLCVAVGVLIWGVAATIGPLVLPDDNDGIIASHNLLAWCAGLCHLLGVSLLGRPQAKSRQPGATLALSYGIAAAIVTLIMTVIAQGWTPTFFVQGQGGTPVRQFVLGSAIIMYGATSILLLRKNLRTPSAFNSWYALAMLLIAVGLLGVMIQSVHGGWVGWTSRFAQWLGSAYMVAAALASVREAGGWRMSLEQTITENQRRLMEQARLLDMTSDAIFIRDLDDRIIYWNRGAVEAYGYSREEAIGQVAHVLLSTQLPQPVTEINQVLDQSGQWQGEVIHTRKNGTKVTDLSRWVVDRTETTHGFAILQTNTNITERKQAEDLHATLAAVVQSSDDAIISKTLEGVITTWNPAAARMFGYSAQEIIGKSVTILIPDDRQEEEPVILAKLRRGERVEHYETVRRRKDGSLLDVSLTVSPVRDAAGKVIGASKIARDITERKRIEATVHDQYRVLELLNETGSSISAKLDLPTIVQAVTDKATQLSGAKFGAFFYNVVTKDGEAFSLYSLSGAPREAFERFGMPRNTPIFSPTFHGDGVVRSADITKDPRYGTMEPHHGMPMGHLPARSYLAVPVISRSGEVIGGLFFGHPGTGVFTERTERIITGVAGQAAVAIDNARLYEDVKLAAEEKASLLEAERAARAEVERTSQLKDQFLATLSHELRTPLNAILGWAQLLRRGKVAEAELTEGVAVIERNARVQTQLIADLLDMSRITSGKVRLDLQPVELPEVMEAAVASVRHAAEAKGIRLQVIMEPLAGPVRGDPNRLQQCVWNLVSNAIKFTPKGGKVQVILQRVNSHVEITVVDSGEGISPEFLPHIFERFRQADASTTRRHGGLGLGLSIVKHLVELHGGTIRASSPGEGQGATFCIELPLMVLEHREPNQPREHPQSVNLEPISFDHPSLNGVRVLVVDDETDGRELVRRVLEECGAQVFVASSAREGLIVVQSKPLDMIISDIGMPGEDGYDFIKQVRELESDQGRIPAAALTAFARAEDRTRALRAGYQIHVAKPVNPSELTAVVASQARRH